MTAFLRSKADVPVWFVGTSRGTDSGATLAVNGGDTFSGAVFTSSVENVVYYDLAKIRIPAGLIFIATFLTGAYFRKNQGAVQRLKTLESAVLFHFLFGRKKKMLIFTS